MIIWTETQTSVKGHEASVDEEVSLRLGDWCTSCFTKATYTRQSLGNDEFIDAVTVPHTKHNSLSYFPTLKMITTAMFWSHVSVNKKHDASSLWIQL